MPPRYAYWTILVDDQPTAFRASAQEDLMPTLKRLQAKHASAKMMWWQNGKLWNSRHEAQDAMHMRGELGRRGDARQEGRGFRDREPRYSKPQGTRASRPEWKPKSAPSPERDQNNKLAWKPKGDFVPAPKRADRPERPRAFDRDRKPEWKPKGFASGRATADKPFNRERKPFTASKPEWKPRPSRPAGKLEWKPKGSGSNSDPSTSAPAKRKWVPKDEYKKSQGIEARRDKNWRPGGEHKDPRQKYKDAKKAKWTRFKKAVRTRWESKAKKKSDE